MGGHEVYYRGGKLTGVKFEGNRKFRFRTLGYDTDKIAELEADADKEKQELDELREIRDNARGRQMDTNDRVREMCEEDESKETDDPDDDSDMK